MKNKYFKEVSVAEAMIEASQKKISTTNTGMQEAMEQRRSVSKRKQSILNTLLSQPSDPNARNHDCQCERFETVTQKFTRHFWWNSTVA